MKPTIKRTLVATLATTALVFGVAAPGFAEETAPATSTPVTTDNVVATETTSSPEETTLTSVSATVAETATETKPGNFPAIAPAPTALAAPVAPTSSQVAPEQPTDSNLLDVQEAYANWDFRLSFRDYVGSENETRTEGLEILKKGQHLLWSPQPGQKLDLSGDTGLLKFTGKVIWQKYDKILNVHIANPTIDFANKVLLVDGYTSGTLAKDGEVSFIQQPIANLNDLRIEKREGYVLVYDLAPIFTDKVRELVGFYASEKAAPIVVTIPTQTGEGTDPQLPVLWEVLPNHYKNPVTGPVYTDAPLREISVPDSGLNACIHTALGVEPEIPLTNKMLEGLQNLSCANSKVKSLTGLEHAVNLTTVNFYLNEINDLTPLSNATKLQTVSIKGNQLTSLKGLENSPQISVLNASSNKLIDVSAVKNMPNLSSLDLSDNRISDITQLAVKLNGDNRLNKLFLKKNRISDLSRFTDLPWARHIDLSYNQIVDLGTLPKQLAVEKLDLEHNFITDPSPFGEWANARNRQFFEQLRIRYNKFTDWSSLADLADEDKVYYFPTPANAENVVNPLKLDELKAAQAEADKAFEAAQAERKAAEEEARRAAEEEAMRNKSYTAVLSWGVKKSFRDYVSGDFAGGKWEVADGVQGTFEFPLLENQKINPFNHDMISFGGKVHFVAHHNILDMTIANPSVENEGGVWKLYADVATRPFDKSKLGLYLGMRSSGAKAPLEPVSALERSEIAVLTQLTENLQNGTKVLHFGKVSLTPQGSLAFAKFYEADQVLDTLNVTIKEGTPIGIRSVYSPMSEAGSDSGKADANKPEAGTPADSTADQKQQTKPVTPEKPQIKKCEVDPAKKRITGGNLAWGVRASFTSYIRGSIAHGGWNLYGTSWDGANFNWSATGGVYNTATKSGTIHYGGSVNFFGHDGILDLTISNPSLIINGNYGALYVTVNGSDMSGKKFNLGRVHFADVAFGGVYEANGSLNFHNASVTLTAAGAKAFIGFYSTGAALAPMSSSVAMINATACDPATGELIEYGAFGGVLSNTGVEVEGMLLASLLALFTGMGALALRRRHLG